VLNSALAVADDALVLNDLTVLVVEPDTFVALDLVMEIEAMHGRVVGPAISLDEAHGAIDSTEVSAAVVNADLGGAVCELFERLEIMQLPHVAHSSSGLCPGGWSRPAPHFTRPVDSRVMLRSLLCEVTRIADSTIPR
jgi:hypothetical protein